MGSTLKSLVLRLLPTSLVLILIAIIFSLIDLAARPDHSHYINDWLFPLTVVTISVMLLMLIGYTVLIIRRLRAKETGSQYALRLMIAFSIFTILPVLIVSYFSLDFIGNRIDEWFNIDIESALEDSIELSQRSLKTGTGLNLRDLKRTARFLLTIDSEDYQHYIEKVRPDLKAYEMVVLNSNKRVIAYSTDSTDRVIPRFPHDEIYQTLSNRGSFTQMEPDSEGGLYTRVALTMQAHSSSEKYILTALFPILQRHSRLAASVQAARDQYKKIKYERESFTWAFRLILLIIMTLSILFALWAAFLYAQRLTAPVKNLVDGTMAVAGGDLQKKLHVSSRDDFSLLARSFNTMTAKLSQAMEDSEASRNQVLTQNNYLNIVLSHLTSGVMTLDTDFNIRRINETGSQLLEVTAEQITEKKLPDLFSLSRIMPHFIDGLMPSLKQSLNNNKNENDSEWKKEIIIVQGNKRRVLMCRGTTMGTLLNGARGFLIVFDDITELIEAEHEAAWGEVARRLAHEIKNPLTPIQLSAERLQHRLAPELSEKSADLLSRMTKTIIHQVGAMKTMVNAFSDYAKTPSMELMPADINTLINEVSELYMKNEEKVKIKLKLNDLPRVLIDNNRMRQVFINLVKNTLEALEQQAEQGELVIHTYLEHSENNNDQFAIIKFIDNGSGFQADVLPNVFEPYVSSKTKGTGLGLAIVKKIIEEHSGQIFANNNDDKGANIEIRLPIS